jgi:hypothetical protein
MHFGDLLRGGQPDGAGGVLSEVLHRRFLGLRRRLEVTQRLADVVGVIAVGDEADQTGNPLLGAVESSAMFVDLDVRLPGRLS